MAPGGKVVAIAAGLLVATSAVLILDGLEGLGQRRGAVGRFQRMAGGFGLGATVCPRWCFVNFDPRLERCTCAEQPLPGGYCYCPEHSGTVTYFAVERLSLASRVRGNWPP